MFAVFDAINEFVFSTILCYVECCNRTNFVTFYLFIYCICVCGVAG